MEAHAALIPLSTRCKPPLPSMGYGYSGQGAMAATRGSVGAGWGEQAPQVHTHTPTLRLDSHTHTPTLHLDTHTHTPPPLHLDWALAVAPAQPGPGCGEQEEKVGNQSNPSPHIYAHAGDQVGFPLATQGAWHWGSSPPWHLISDPMFTWLLGWTRLDAAGSFLCKSPPGLAASAVIPLASPSSQQ